MFGTRQACLPSQVASFLLGVGRNNIPDCILALRIPCTVEPVLVQISEITVLHREGSTKTIPLTEYIQFSCMGQHNGWTLSELGTGVGPDQAPHGMRAGLP